MENQRLFRLKSQCYNFRWENEWKKKHTHSKQTNEKKKFREKKNLNHNCNFNCTCDVVNIARFVCSTRSLLRTQHICAIWIWSTRHEFRWKIDLFFVFALPANLKKRNPFRLRVALHRDKDANITINTRHNFHHSNRISNWRSMHLTTLAHRASLPVDDYVYFSFHFNKCNL